MCSSDLGAIILVNYDYYLTRTTANAAPYTYKHSQTSATDSYSNIYNLFEVDGDVYELVPAGLDIEIDFERILSFGEYQYNDEWDAEAWRNKMRSFDNIIIKNDYFKHSNFMRKNRNRQKR